MHILAVGCQASALCVTLAEVLDGVQRMRTQRVGDHAFKVFVIKLSTKYYSATVELWVAADSKKIDEAAQKGDWSEFEAVADGCEGLFVAFNAGREKEFNTTKAWAGFADHFGLQLNIFAGDGESPGVDEDRVRRRVSFCLENGFEYLELDSSKPEAGGDSREKEGVPRLVEAMECHMWTEMEYTTDRRPVKALVDADLELSNDASAPLPAFEFTNNPRVLMVGTSVEESRAEVRRKIAQVLVSFDALVAKDNEGGVEQTIAAVDAKCVVTATGGGTGGVFEVYLFSITTKYYATDVELWVHLGDQAGTEQSPLQQVEMAMAEVVSKCEGVILVCEDHVAPAGAGQSIFASAQVDQWVAFAQTHDIALRLFVAEGMAALGAGRSAGGGAKTHAEFEEEQRNRMLWCLDRGFEYLEADALACADADALRRGHAAREKDGVPRLVEAMQSHLWSSMSYTTPKRPTEVGDGSGAARNTFPTALSSSAAPAATATTTSSSARTTAEVASYTEVEMLELKDAVAAAESAKEAGTALFKASQYAMACDEYRKTIAILKPYSVHGGRYREGAERQGTEEESALCTRVRELSQACFLNAAACYLKLEKWVLAIDQASAALDVLEHGTKGKGKRRTSTSVEDVKAFVKGLFRRGSAYMHSGELDLALKDLTRGCKLAPKNADMRRLLKQVKDKLSAVQQREKEKADAQAEASRIVAASPAETQKLANAAMSARKELSEEINFEETDKLFQEISKVRSHSAQGSVSDHERRERAAEKAMELWSAMGLGDEESSDDE